MAASMCVVQMDDRPADDRALQQVQPLLEHNREAAGAEGVPYTFYDRGGEMPPYWQKVRIVADALSSGRCDSVLWLDSDAAVANGYAQLARLLPEDKHMLVGRDLPEYAAYGPTGFNAGAFLVRNSEVGRAIVDEWLTLFPSHAWSRPGARWECREESGEYCRWAGPRFEQGAFEEQVLPLRRSSIQVVDYSAMNSPCRTPREAARASVCHFSQKHRGNIDEALRTLQKNYVGA